VSLRPVVIDLESYYDSDYTFSKLTTEEYIRHPKFELHGGAVKWKPDIPARWYDERQLRYIIKEEDWSDVLLICHHCQWDGGALAWRYGVHPKMYGCTLAMNRLWLGNHISVSLESVRKHWGMQPKTTPYNQFIGKHWSELSRDTQTLLAEGCEDEAESIWKIFGLLLQQGFPRGELPAIDVMLRMFIDPRLVGDVDLLARLWEDENNAKALRLETLGVEATDLASSEKFAALLRNEGVEPATKNGKVDPKTGQPREIYAFAKTDPFMVELRESDDDRVRLLAEARLGEKSTLIQTRAETLGWMARRGNLAVYICPYGAITTRPAGGDSSNFLNLKRNDPDFPMDKGGMNIKESICAPEGYYLAPIDNSQIECRLLNKIAGQDDVIERFATGADPYINVASQFYGFPVNKKDHPKERQVGKVIELQAGYMSGGEKIRATLRTKAGILISEAEGVKARDAYRNTHPEVKRLWDRGRDMIQVLANGGTEQWGPATIRDKRMWLPNGTPIIFDTLEYFHDEEKGDRYWRVRRRDGWKKLYGAKLVENLMQGLAWVLTSAAMVRIHNLGFRVLNAPYDEVLVLIPKDGKEQQNLEACKNEMKRVPEWLPDIPLECEGSLGERYSK
jgi:hypothetical protein